MRYSNRLFLYAPFVALLLVAAVAMLRWHALAQRWEKALLAANHGAEIAPGVTLHFASEEIGGFPFNLDVILNKSVISVRSTRGPISLASEQFAVHALTYGRAQQVIEAAGVQTLSWTDAEAGTHGFSFVPGSLRASAIERNGHLTRFDLDLNTFGSRALKGGRAQFHIRAASDRDALDFTFGGEDLHVLSSGKTDAATLSRIAIEGRITPATPFSPLLSGKDDWRRAIENWRDESGVLQLDHVDVVWDASHLTGRGTLALDENHYINGQLQVLLSGFSDWRPQHLVDTRFTQALQEGTNAIARVSTSPFPLLLDIRNGAAVVNAAGSMHRAGTIDRIF